MEKMVILMAKIPGLSTEVLVSVLHLPFAAGASLSESLDHPRWSLEVGWMRLHQ